MLPDNLRQQLGRLKEQGCPAALIDRAMGIDLSSDREWHVGYRQGRLLFNSRTSKNHMFLWLQSDGLATIEIFSQTGDGETFDHVVIPAPQVDA